MSVRASRQPDLVYDVGAHKGEDTEFYLKKGFRVVAIEANPSLCSALRVKFARELEHHQLEFLNVAIADHDGYIDFYVNDKLTIWGTVNPQWALRNEKMGAPSHTVKVKAERFDNILRQYGVPHYLKIDIEGADLLCATALRGLVAKPQFLSIESNKLEWAGLVAEFDLLEALGYKKFKVINQARITEQHPPNPSREGQYVDHQFLPDCTGLFGNELPGEWLTRDQALDKYHAIFLKYRYFGDSKLAGKFVNRIPWLRSYLLPGWHDTHASLDS